MERQRALLGQMHTVYSESEATPGEALTFLKSQQSSPARLSQCQAVLWSPGWGRDKAANSTRGSQFLLGQAWLLLYREIFTGTFWIYTSSVCEDTRCLSKRACGHQESGGFSTAQKAATSLCSGWVLTSLGFFTLSTVRSPFHCRKHRRADTVSQNSHKWHVTHLHCI